MTPAGSAPAPSALTVLVLQGGGALGSYQGGVYQAFSEAGVEPDWVAGISIGAINAAIIAGNPRERRLEQLDGFWRLLSSGVLPRPPLPGGPGRTAFNEWSAAWGATFGVPGMFTPRLPGPLFYPAGSPEALSFYDTAPLRRTLEEYVDFDRINAGETRFSVGAVNIRTGNFIYFDNTERRIGPEHVMASGALPPGFPPVKIDGEFYWDGGLVSNTPLEYVLDQQGDRDLVVHQVDLFGARGRMPKTLFEAAEREKDIRFSSRTRLNTDANLKIRRAKAALRDLIAALPPELAEDANTQLLADLARDNALTVVQLIYRRKPHEGGSRDFEFSRQTMLDHWAAGVGDVRHFLSQPLPEVGAAHVVVVDPGRDRETIPG
jgi:NTE family protein